jgi:hypothetical protein
MFEDILEGFQEKEIREDTPGVPEYEDPANVMSVDTDDWDTNDDWNANESWSTSNPDEVWRT